MSGLQRTTLGECCEIVSGATPSTSVADYWDGDIEWATPKDLSDLESKLISQTARRITDKGLASCAASVLPPNSVLFSSRAPIGHVAINTVAMATNQGFKSFVPKANRVEPSFLYHWLRAHRAHIESLGNGATFKEVSKAVVSRVEIELPPLAEQRRIADILDKADAIRRKRKEAIALTEELLRSAFLEMFGDPVTNPKGWPVKPLGDVSDVSGGLQVTSARASNPISMPYLRVANVYRGRLELSEVKEIRVTEAERVRATLRSGDVLVVEGHGNPEELGRSAVWRDEVAGCTHQNHLIRVRATAGVLNATFLSAFLNSSSGRKQMLALGKTTSGLNTISTNNVRSVLIVVPPLKKQVEYAEVAVRVATLEKTVQLRSEGDEDLFNSLVARAFSGALESSR